MEKLYITEKDDERAGDFYIKYIDKLDSYDNQLHELRIAGKYDLALKILDELEAFCLSKGRGGKVHYYQMYECMHNSSNPCFTYRELILSEMNK